MSKEVKQVKETTVEEMVDSLVLKATKAKEAMLDLNQEAVDKIVAAMAKAGLDKHIELAQLAIEETQRGVFEDKVTKNIFATEYIYNSIKYNKTVGVIEENDEEIKNSVVRKESIENDKEISEIKKDTIDKPKEVANTQEENVFKKFAYNLNPEEKEIINIFLEKVSSKIGRR